MISPEVVLLMCSVALGMIAALQVWLNRRARRSQLRGFGLHLEFDRDRLVICDDSGRKLRAVRKFRFESGYDRIDTLQIDVFCEVDGQKFLGGRRTGPRVHG